MKIKILFAIVLILVLLIVGIVYGINKEKIMVPTFNFMLEEEESKIWVGTFQLAWNELIDINNVKEIILEDGNPEMVEQLNKQDFTKANISEEDYYIKVGEMNDATLQDIKADLMEKFNFEPTTLDISFRNNSESNNEIIYAMLKKDFNFIVPFDRLLNSKFNNSKERVKMFGIIKNSTEELNQNVNVLFYNDTNFAVKLNTKENEEIYLYKTNEENSFYNLYVKMLEESKIYAGDTTFNENDEISIPYIELSEYIEYSQLLDKKIDNIDGKSKIVNALQNVHFNLNNVGGHVASESNIVTNDFSIDNNKSSLTNRKFEYNETFIMFLKEKDKKLPYMALKIDNTDFLVNEDSNE